MKDLSIIIVAGGRGLRMESSLPKQYLMLHVKPILIWTIENVYHSLPDDIETEIILVRSRADKRYVEEMLKEYTHDAIPLLFADGGDNRAESVYNGLCLASGNYVAIHDGVRPFVNPALLGRIWEARKHNAVIPAILPTDSIRISGNNGIFSSYPRADIRLIQTPQLFTNETLKNAYKSYRDDPDERCTDDASIVEKYTSSSPFIVDGDELNIKITTPKDLYIADLFINKGLFK